MGLYVVVSAFKDKNTGEHFAKGSTYKSTDKDRIAELQGNGFLGEEIKGQTTKKKSKKDSADGTSEDKTSSSADAPADKAANTETTPVQNDKAVDPNATTQQPSK